MKLIVSVFIAAALVAKNGIDLPAAALPSFAMIFVIYGLLMLWELRVLLPPTRPPSPQPREQKPASRPVSFRLAHRH